MEWTLPHTYQLPPVAWVSTLGPPECVALHNVGEDFVYNAAAAKVEIRENSRGMPAV
jgi:hypothetical protein